MTTDPTPDWYRGDEPFEVCDFIPREGVHACDRPAAYIVKWRIASCDLGRQQFSTSCVEHGHRVPRTEVVKMQQVDPVPARA
jgi:hypothetical protein